MAFPTPKTLPVSILLLEALMIPGILLTDVCTLPGCLCKNDIAHADDIEGADMYDVTCFVRSVAMSDDTISRLPSNITSITFVCSDDTLNSYLTPGLFRRTPNIRRLGLTQCHFFLVSGDVFSEVPRLQSLEIKTCKFQADLPSDLFQNASKMKNLTITDCGLTSFPGLCSSAELETLNVSDQVLTSADEWVEDCRTNFTLSQLTVIDLSNNSLSTLPKKLLTKAPNLKELYVSFNGIQDISYDFQQLQILEAEGQEIHSVDFIELPFARKLKVLKIAGDGLTKFPVEKTKGFTNLSHLYLENFGIDDAVWDVLPTLPNLANLNLANNTVVSISLSENPGLVELNLTRNQVVRPSDDAFPYPNNLTLLDLSWNSVESISGDTFRNLTFLTHLYLSHNRLDFVFYNSFTNLSKLQYLYLGNNNLRSLPINMLKETKLLKELDIGNNSLYMLPLTDGLTKLFALNLNHNQLPILPASRFRDLKNLEYLFARGNKLSMVDPTMFDTTPILRFLDLRDNRISLFIPFAYHPTISMILLDNNLLQDITFTFLSLPSLQILFVGENYLTRLTKNMLPSNLRTLYAAWNHIIYVDDHIFLDLPKLGIVNVFANFRLSKLTMAQVQVLPGIRPKPSFIIAPNWFLCDCEMAYLKAWEKHRDTAPFLRDNLPVFEHLEELRCQTYFSGNRTVFFLKLSLSDFVCPYERPFCDNNCTCCASNGTLIDPACTCVLTCPDRCACFYGGSVYVKLYIHARCERRNLTEIPDGIPARATHVRLDGNNLTTIDNETFKHLKDVMFLYLNNSQLTEIEPESFKDLSALLILDLSNNLLQRIDEHTFVKIDSLSELYLQYNQIIYIHPKAFYGLPTLSILHLNHNRLKYIDSFQYFPAVAFLTMTSNPWSCGCSFASRFLKFLFANSEEIRDFRLLRCFFAEEDARLLQHLQNSSRTLSGFIDYLPRDTLEYSNTDNNEGFKTSESQNPAGNETVPASESINNDSHSAADQHKDIDKDILRNDTRATFGYESFIADDVINDVISNKTHVPSILMHRYNYELICAKTYSAVSVIYQASFFDDKSHVAAIAVVVSVAVVVVVVGTLVVRRRREVQAFMYDKFGLRIWDKTAQIDREYETNRRSGSTNHPPLTYDAFVSYSHEDEDFVLHTLAPRLEEQGPRVYKLCLHYRDFPVGGFIADTIIDSIEASRRTIMLLSEKFLRSEWCRFEFQTAHRHVLKEGDHRLIIILLEDVKEENLDPDLKVAMKTRTYLRADDLWFWEKLYFALPDVPRRKRRDRNTPQEQRDSKISLQSISDTPLWRLEADTQGTPNNSEINTAQDSQVKHLTDVQAVGDRQAGIVDDTQVGNKVECGETESADEVTEEAIDGREELETVSEGREKTVVWEVQELGENGAQETTVNNRETEGADETYMKRVDEKQHMRDDDTQAATVDEIETETMDEAHTETVYDGQITNDDDAKGAQENDAPLPDARQTGLQNMNDEEVSLHNVNLELLEGAQNKQMMSS